MHLSAVKAEFNGKLSDYQRQRIFGALAGFNQAQNRTPEVRIKRFANNELRITMPQMVPPAKRRGSESGAAACLAAGEAALVYNDKVQHPVFEGSVSRSRPRPVKLTSYGAHIVREACAIIEGVYPRDSYFITLTLPGSTQEAIDTFAHHASGILNAYMQRVRHHLQRCSPKVTDGGEDLLACGVWEYQKRSALHFHLLIGSDNQRFVKLFRRQHKKWWRKILLHYSEKTGVDLFARAEGGSWKDSKSKPRCQFAKVRKSVTRYMAKYLAKGKAEIIRDGWAPPAMWFFRSNAVWKRVVAERRLNTIKFLAPGDMDAFFTQSLEVAQDAGGKVFFTENPFTGKTCGAVIYFENEAKDLVFEIWNETLEALRDEHDCVQSRGDPWLGKSDNPFANLCDAELIFEGKALDVDAALGADLCAPFSAPEKGGGMR